VPWCDADGECKMRDRWMEDSEAHVIAGWGSYLTYHPACCPRENIVGECHEEHPPPRLEEYGTLPFRHDHYLKLWHLSGPKINADYILFDEAQDANPVLVDIVRQQTHAQLVWVGDSSSRSTASPARSTRSRGRRRAERVPPLAELPVRPRDRRRRERCLDALNAKLRLTGTDAIAASSRSRPRVRHPEPHERRAVRELLDALKAGSAPHLVGGGRDVVDFAKAAQSLQLRRVGRHPSWPASPPGARCRTYVEQDEQGGDLRSSST
jgi:hypothetical protein